MSSDDSKQGTVRRLKNQFVESQKTKQEYVPNIQNVGQLDQNEIDTMLKAKEYEYKTNDNIGKIQDISQYEQAALEYEKEKEKEKFELLKRQQKMEYLIIQQVKNTIGDSPWNKTKISEWMQEIIDSIGEILDHYLSNLGVFKYSIDVIIIKSTSIAKQNEHLMSPMTDYSFNIKIKNNNGITTLVNVHAFRVANI